MSADYKAAAKVAEEITNAPLFSREVRNLAAAHLELLARLDEAAGRIFGPGVFADAAAAIRELEAKLEAALAPERTAAGQQPWLIRTCNHEWFEGRCVHCNVKAVDGRAAPASPLPPGLERASLTHNPTHGAALWLGKRLVARIAGGAEVSAVTESDPIPQWRKDAETFVNAVNSASSPLLGLELAQEMLEDAEVTNDISESEADAFGADDSAVYHRAARKELAKVGQAISAEISRLKGEGSESC